MKQFSLSHLVVSCKEYVPWYDCYLRKSDGYFYAATNSPEGLGYDEKLLKEYEESDDYVLMPECHEMTDEEAAEVIRDWCAKNEIPFFEDMENIKETYLSYYG